MGGITVSLIWDGDIQIPGSCQKFVAIPPSRGQRCLPSIWRALVWANSQFVQLGPGVPHVPSATIGHGDDMDFEIQTRLGFGLNPGLRAGLRPGVGSTGAVSLPHASYQGGIGYGA